MSLLSTVLIIVGYGVIVYLLALYCLSMHMQDKLEQNGEVKTLFTDIILIPKEK